MHSIAKTCRSENDDNIPLRIRTALVTKNKSHKAFRKQREHFGHSVGLFPRTKGDKLANVPTITLPQPKNAYPPSGNDIYETAEIQRIWEAHRKVTCYPDPRGEWKPLLELDPEQLQYTVDVDKSAIIRDRATSGIIGVVIRNFSNNNERLLDWINGIVEQNTVLHKSVWVCLVFWLSLLVFSMLFSWRTLCQGRRDHRNRCRRRQQCD